MRENRLEGKCAVVTGSSRGIGRAIAFTLATEGARIVVNYARSSELAAEVVESIHQIGGQAIAVQADVADEEQSKLLIKKALEQYGKLDILVNNAGITRDKLMLRMSMDDWDEVIRTNLRGAFCCSHAALPHFFKQRGGIIVNITSVIGKVGGAGQANYSAAKAGLIGLTKSLAREMGGRNIRVNGVAPGYIETDMTDALPQEYRDTIRKQIPLARFGSPEDVANLVAFLCSDDSAYIQGEVIAVDGGLAM